VTGNRCYGVAADPRINTASGINTTLIDLRLRNNGTRRNTYTIQVDGPDWVDIRPRQLAVPAGETGTAYLYAAPDYASNGTYTTKVVITG
ncbi:MAG: hypothetical protein ABEK12_02750, partial [Candidatus Nanohaloarchaea archaeon]